MSSPFPYGDGQENRYKIRMDPQQKKRIKAQAKRTISKKRSTSKTSCMRNSVILRTITSYLSTADLINFRLVSKFLHFEINSAMHRSVVSLKISLECLLYQVEKLNDLIPKMSLPLNGLAFSKSRWQSGKKVSDNAILQEFLRVLPPIKHLKFSDYSASEELILRIMELNVNHLETLSIYDAGINVPTEILGAIFQLKKICLTTYSSEFGDRGNLSAVIQKCETLETVEGIAFQDLTGVSENQWHVIKDFDVFIDAGPFDWRPLEKYLQVVKARRRFNTLTIDCWHTSHREKQMLMNIVYSCKETLKSLRLALGTFNFQSVYDLCGEGFHLRSLILDGCAQSSEHLESELLDLFPEEVLLLRDMNLNYVAQLRKLQIVPVRPALHYLTGLLELTIDIVLEQDQRTNLMYWDSKRHGINFERLRDASKMVKALSLQRLWTLWI